MDIFSQNTFLQNWHSTESVRIIGRKKAIIIVNHILSAKLGRMICRYCSQSVLVLQFVFVFVFLFLFIFLLFSCLQIIGRETANLWRWLPPITQFVALALLIPPPLAKLATNFAFHFQPLNNNWSKTLSKTQRECYCQRTNRTGHKSYNLLKHIILTSSDDHLCSVPPLVWYCRPWKT